MNIAGTIIDQLGGSKFMIMTGSKNFLSTATGILFHIVGCKKYNRCQIKLTNRDDYDVMFFRLTSRLDIVSKKVLNGVFCDGLQDIFTSETGLLCSL